MIEVDAVFSAVGDGLLAEALAEFPRLVAADVHLALRMGVAACAHPTHGRAGMIRITAMKWAPPFAAGRVRDHRVRWVLREVGWPYEVRLLDAPGMKSADYRRAQPAPRHVSSRRPNYAR